MENIIPVYIVNKKKLNPWNFVAGFIVFMVIMNFDEISNYIKLFFKKTIGIEIATGLFIFFCMMFYIYNFKKKIRTVREKINRV